MVWLPIGSVANLSVLQHIDVFAFSGPVPWASNPLKSLGFATPPTAARVQDFLLLFRREIHKIQSHAGVRAYGRREPAPLIQRRIEPRNIAYP
jgi:hypothetical protein